MNGYCLRAQVVIRDHESTFYKYKSSRKYLCRYSQIRKSLKEKELDVRLFYSSFYNFRRIFNENLMKSFARDK